MLLGIRIRATPSSAFYDLVWWIIFMIKPVCFIKYNNTILCDRPQNDYFITDSHFKLTIGHQIKMAWISETWSTYSVTRVKQYLWILSRFSGILLRSILSYVKMSFYNSKKQWKLSSLLIALTLIFSFILSSWIILLDTDNIAQIEFRITNQISKFWTSFFSRYLGKYAYDMRCILYIIYNIDHLTTVTIAVGSYTYESICQKLLSISQNYLELQVWLNPLNGSMDIPGSHCVSDRWPSRSAFTFNFF